MDYIIEGKEVGLTPIKREYIDKYQSWINDMRVNRYLDNFGSALTREQEEEWIDGSKNQDDQHNFTIHSLKDGEPIGNCSLFDISYRNKRAGFGIMIGEKEYRNKGLGTEAVRLTLDYGFTVLNLRSINLDVMEFNSRAKRTYRKVGFKEAGRLRDHQMIDGEHFDLIIMDIIRKEFYCKNESIIRNNYLDEIK